MSEPRPDRYAVVGNPIHHSLSPRIHTLFAEQTGQNLVYGARLGTPGQFAEEINGWFAEGLKGLNVTVPFKEEAFALTRVLTDRARHAGAVNTLWRDDEYRIHGDNTDGIGFCRDLDRLGFDVRNRHILILGAGGATRGLLQPLLEGAPEALVIANRTVTRAEGLVEAFRDIAPATRLSACGLDTLPQGPFDLVVNATATGLGEDTLDLPVHLVHADSLAYDLVYGTGAQRFLAWAADAGCANGSDGLGMLVEQAAEAFAIWRGVHPETDPVLRELRHEIAAQ
ncbi:MULTISPECIES: shikimate dehydrogenase [unclassified Thioalkalivibrio]|uniref:shikimate dehydrogenase n=1 Tax=unclassified Thioalkalivibrio TaxID=2621013 RepID=UPI0003799517|nr:MULTISPECIES: shikimate dehydrogenase [unclassified Thioalkalivibrio]